MPDNVRCKDCGFLAARHPQTRQLIEAESKFRDGALDQGHGWPGIYEPRPVCFMQLCEFPVEIGYPQSVKVMAQERDCDSFTPWKQGFTSKEHQEMLDRQFMLDWQKEREEEDRKWREGESRLARVDARQARWIHLAEIIVIGIISVAAIIAQITTSRNQAGAAQTRDPRGFKPPQLTLQERSADPEGRRSL